MKSMHLLSPRTHAILDYVTVAGFALAPLILDLGSAGSALAWTLSVVHLAMTLATDAPFAVTQLVPGKLHGAVELLVGIALVVGSTVLTGVFIPTAQVFFGGAGVVILLVWLTSDYGVRTELSPATS